MASPAAALPSDHEPVPPPEPQAVRACLTPDVAAEFDAEWEVVLDKATASSTTGPDVWTRFFDLRRCQPGVPGDQAFLLDLAL